MSNNESNDELGSLAQSSRLATLKSARTTMYVIGVLTLLVNGGLALFAQAVVDSQFETEIKQLQQQGMQLDQAQLAQLKKDAVVATQLMSAGFAVLGIVFLVLGAMIEKAPVPITVVALILYLGGWGISALLDPTMIFKGVIIKVIIIAALVKAIQAAIAYQNEAARE